MAAIRPDLVIRFDIDALTAHGRKPDHAPALIGAKIAAMDGLTFNDAASVTIDARAPYAEVFRAVRAQCDSRLDFAARKPRTLPDQLAHAAPDALPLAS